MNYILDGKKTVKCDDIVKWAQWFEKADRHVARTEKDGVKISTVFLGIDYSYGDSKPLLFETMIFGGKHDQDQWRYETWEEAETGHITACAIAGVKYKKKKPYTGTDKGKINRATSGVLLGKDIPV